jgi:hypothetical protein
VIRRDDRRSSGREAIGTDHLESIDGAYQASESTANLLVGRSGKQYETLLCADPPN